MSRTNVAVIGAGPYGLSVAAHLGGHNIETRLFGRPMQFWSQVAQGGDERYLKTYCFGTSLSSPAPGFAFGDYNGPRGLPTYEPCSMANFTSYGQWFAQNNVPWAEPVNVTRVVRQSDGFSITLSTGEGLTAKQVVIATGLAYFASTPSVLAALPASVATHTARVMNFEQFRGKSVAIVGAGQSALEAAALLHEIGAKPHLLVREDKVLWHDEIPEGGRSLWRKFRSPKSGLGYGPKAWVLSNFPGGLHKLPEKMRTKFVLSHLPPEGAWWLRPRVENLVPINLQSTVVTASVRGERVALQVRDAAANREHEMEFDHVIAGSGYDLNVQRLEFLDAPLRNAVECIERSPRLNSNFESSVPGLHFVGPISAMSFGPLFRFVAGADYTARRVSAHLAAHAAPVHAPVEVSSAA